MNNYLDELEAKTIYILREAYNRVEPLAMLWITCYFRSNSGNHAFKLLRK